MRDHNDGHSPNRRRRTGFAKRVERGCCMALTMFPLLFVYGLTTWACWVGVVMGFPPFRGHWNDPITSTIIFVLYALANSSYTIAVFTSPGTPLNAFPGATTGSYSALPTHETSHPAPQYTSLTTKSSGHPRYCKKCRCVKPDRAHHCSTCGRCVLKMDHHCPWLATCVGLRNYKAFLLFLVYTSLFCIACFIVSAQWTWAELFNVNNMQQGRMTVNVILLAVLSGIIGLVLSGFTAWHMWLAATGQTTIECLEKTRYLSPVKKSMERQFRHQRTQGEDQEEPLLDQLKEIHANVLPGVTRPEEGEERDSNASTPVSERRHYDSPASESLRRSYRELEQQRERERYDAYLDEKDSEKLPNAFDLGWRRNLSHLFGNKPLLWFLPVCNTSGDGWQWDVSETWMEKRMEVAREREQRQQSAEQSWREGASNGFGMPTSTPLIAGAGRHYYEPPAPHHQRVENDSHRQAAHPVNPHGVPLQHLGRDRHEEYEVGLPRGAASSWNDMPDDMIRSSSRSGGSRTKDD